MKHDEFCVSKFENRNGVTSWRVTGWLHGLRIRKNFKTREEAAAEKATLELKTLQTTAGMRPAMNIKMCFLVEAFITVSNVAVVALVTGTSIWRRGLHTLVSFCQRRIVV